MKQSELIVPQNSKLVVTAGVLYIISAVFSCVAYIGNLQDVQDKFMFTISFINNSLPLVMYAVITLFLAKRNVKFYAIPIVYRLLLAVLRMALKIYNRMNPPLTFPPRFFPENPAALAWSYYIWPGITIMVFVILLMFVLGYRRLKIPVLCLMGALLLENVYYLVTEVPLLDYVRYAIPFLSSYKGFITIFLSGSLFSLLSAVLSGVALIFIVWAIRPVGSGSEASDQVLPAQAESDDAENSDDVFEGEPSD